MKIYTKTGDSGETSLYGGARVRKDDSRIEAYGTVDELNSFIGVARAVWPSSSFDPQLHVIQSDLFDIGAHLASPGISRFAGPDTARVVALEEVVVPAGSYKAFRIESSGESISPRSALRLHTMVWVDPATMTVVRLDTRHQSYVGTQFHQDFTDVLLWRKPVPRS